MAWINYKKKHDMVPHSWIWESLELNQVSDTIFEFVKRSVANWQTELTSCGVNLVKKKWGVIVVDRGKVKSTDAIELPSGEKIREIEEDR